MSRRQNDTRSSAIGGRGTMDRRRFKSRTGLHRGLQPAATDASSQASLRDEPASSGTSRSSVRGTPRVSNSEILRRQTRSFSNVDGSGDTKRNMPESPNRPLVKSKSALPSRTRKSVRDSSDSDEVSNEDSPMGRKSPLKESSSNVTRKQQNLANVTKKQYSAEKESNERLLSKRRKSVVPESGSESDSSLKCRPLKMRRIDPNLSGPMTKADKSDSPLKSSPLKMRRIDPNLSRPMPEADGSPDKRPSQRSQLSRLSLSGRPVSSRRTHTQRESNTSKLKKLASPVKAAEEAPDRELEESSPDKRTCGNKLEDFLTKSGIRLTEEDGPYQLDEDPPTVEKKMIQLLSSGKFKKEEIVDLWRTYISDESNLKRALNDVTITSDQSATRAGSNVSLVRMFLQIPSIQTAVSSHLLQKLNEAVLVANSMEDVPWSSLVLQQFRFLETVTDTKSLATSLEELLETSPLEFQRDIVVFLPDIIIDEQHHAMAEMLSKLMETRVELTNIVLDCITNLTLGKEYLEELRDKVLDMLKTNVNVERIPAMTRFVLNECPTVEVCQKTLKVLRSLDLQPLSGEKSDEYYTSQSFLVSGLKMSIMLSKDMANAAIAVVKRTDEPPRPMDLVIILLVYSDTHKKKNAENVLKQHVKSGFYRASLLGSFYQDYKGVATDLQPEALLLSSDLLKSEDRVYVDFASEWFRHQFVSQAKAIHEQREIIEKIILLMGNNDQTAKGALGILRRLTENDDERAYLQAHCNHLRILLEKIDNFDLQEVATLSDLLYALCTSSNGSSEALQDDLFILLQKQLSDAKTLTKCKGVLSAAMAIKHLAGKPESCKVAEDLFLKVGAGTKNCPRSRALFYDQIGRVIADTKDIDSDFLKALTIKFQDEFVDAYMTDMNNYRGELVSKFGLNDQSNDEQKCVVNFGDGKHGAVTPAFFRLLRICFMRLSEGDLEEINMLLGCPVLFPKDTEIAEPWTLDLMICCINWFRELISGFVTQTDPVLQEQVLKRLEDLMTLQAEFSTMLTLCDTRYQPPPCYFHLFPAPAFVRVEKKVAKKGKRTSMDKTTSLPEWEAWEIGSSLSSKNPTYFRHMDAKVVDLLDLKMDQDITQSPKNISKAQVCFLIRELLGMFEGGEASETLMRDLIHLLPKICAKLHDIVVELREKDDMKNRQAAKLILSLLTMIFDWKGFKSAMYHSMLRDGLRTLAGQIDKSNSMLRSSKELVAESYKYFESLCDIATDISLAFALVKMCRTLMKHSETFVRQYKSKQAKMAYGFLSLEWPDDRPTTSTYRAAAVGLLSNWIQNEPDPLETVTAALEWLPDEVATLEGLQDRLQRLPTITKANFHYMFQRIFEGLINGAKISFAAATTDPKRIQVWQQVGNNIQKFVKICDKSHNKMRSLLAPFLRSMTLLVKLFINSAMPIMEANLRYQPDEVTGILKMLQTGTRHVNKVCVESTQTKDITLAKLVPSAKQTAERLVYLVKGMLVLNNSADAFWMGNLVNKNLEGQQILSQSSDEVSATASGADDDNDEAMSDILQSDVDDEASGDDE